MDDDGGMAIDVDAYFDRIGYHGSGEPTRETLGALVACHNRTIPFENLDPLMGVPVFDLSAAALEDKLVRRRRGGYCYEHNGLLGYVLEQLGAQVERLVGRVVWMHDTDDLPAQTHQALAVRLPEGRYLVDVGFGGQTPTSPLRFETETVQQTRHEPYRLLDHPHGYELQAQVRGQWQSLYLLDPHPRPMIDLQVGSWYVSTHPASTFVVGLSAAVVTDDARFNLRGRHLAVHRGGETERIRLDTAAAVLDVLAGRFGIDLSDVGDPAALAGRVEQVLDR